METGYFQKRVQEIVQEYQRRLNVNPLKPPPTLQKSSVAAKSLFFIDDLSLAPTNENGNAQPIMEVIRQIMSEGKIFALQSFMPL